jgi:hypothetical protein
MGAPYQQFRYAVIAHSDDRKIGSERTAGRWESCAGEAKIEDVSGPGMPRRNFEPDPMRSNCVPTSKVLTMGGFLDEAPTSRSGRAWRPNRPDGCRCEGCPIYRWCSCRAGTADGDPGRVLPTLPPPLASPLASPPLGTSSPAPLGLIKPCVRPASNRASVPGFTLRAGQNRQPSREFAPGRFAP